MMATLPTKMSKFNFKGLSPEIRLMIYPLSRNLMQGFDGTLPALLLALKGGDQTMYEEAYHAYLKTNLIVSEDTFESLKQIPEKEMMKVQHLKIVWTDQGVHTSEFHRDTRTPDAPIEHRPMASNHLETLSIDFTGRRRYEYRETASFVETVSKASSCLRRVAFRMDSPKDIRHQTVIWFDPEFGLKGKLELASPSSYSDWVWEAEDGEQLKGKW